MSETTAADAGAWHEPPTGFFGRMVERTARLLGVTHPDAGLAVPASPAGETGLGSSLAHGIAETARAIETKGATVAGQAAKAAEIYGPTVLKAADVAATDVSAVISVLSLSGDTPDSERPRPHAMSMTTTKPLTTAQTKATTSEDIACRATPDDAVGTPAGSARNIDKTLPEALQTSSQTARKNAFFPDPVMRGSGLRPFGPTPVRGAQEQCALWQAHHLISVSEVQSTRFRQLFTAAGKDGWTADEKANVIGLPYEPNAQRMLHDTGLPGADRPMHDNSHQSDYKLAVNAQLMNAMRRLTTSPYHRDSREFNELARTLVEKSQTRLRDTVLSHGLGRLTEAEPARRIQEAAAADPWKQELEKLERRSARPFATSNIGHQEAPARDVWKHGPRPDVAIDDVKFTAEKRPAQSASSRMS